MPTQQTARTMDDVHQALLTLQELDDEIAEAVRRLDEFGPQLEQIEGPAAGLSREVEGVRTRLQELRGEARRLERGAADKQERLKQYQDRLQRVRNAREEAAARTELDLIRRAAEADEQEALEHMEQATRTELKLDEMEKQLEKLRAELAPQRTELLEARAAVEQDLAVLRDRRENHAIRIDARTRQLYERVKAGRTRAVLAPLTADGACGHCFSIVPVQQQNEIRIASTLHRCEACGVILYIADES